MDFKNYLSNGIFQTHIPGQSIEIELNKKSADFDTFLQNKEAKEFFFISADDLSLIGPIEDAEEERIYLDKQGEHMMDYLMHAMGEGWHYYLGGFRTNSNLGGLGGIFVLNIAEETIKNFLSQKEGYKWYIKGAIGESATIIEWE